MPEGFAFPFNHRFWVPLIPDPGLPEPRTGPGIEVFERLAPGATLESARAELRVVMNGTALEFPELYAQLEPQVRPYTGPLDGAGGIDGMIAFTEFALMNLPAAMILLLVCVNFAILVYTRTAESGAHFLRGNAVVVLTLTAFFMMGVGDAEATPRRGIGRVQPSKNRIPSPWFASFIVH